MYLHFRRPPRTSTVSWLDHDPTKLEAAKRRRAVPRRAASSRTKAAPWSVLRLRRSATWRSHCSCHGSSLFRPFDVGIFHEPSRPRGSMGIRHLRNPPYGYTMVADDVDGSSNTFLCASRRAFALPWLVACSLQYTIIWNCIRNETSLSPITCYLYAN